MPAAAKKKTVTCIARWLRKRLRPAAAIWSTDSASAGEDLNLPLPGACCLFERAYATRGETLFNQMTAVPLVYSSHTKQKKWSTMSWLEVEI
jgi:hypothetical protein